MPTRFSVFYLEVCIAHPVFDGPEWMLDGFAPLARLLRVLVEPPLDGLEDGFVLPAGDPALLARGAADHARTPARCGHGAGIGIGERDLLVRRCKHPGLEIFQAPHLLLQRGDLVFQAGRLSRARQRRLLPVGAVQLVQIALDRLLDLLQAALSSSRA